MRAKAKSHLQDVDERRHSMAKHPRQTAVKQPRKRPDPVVTDQQRAFVDAYLRTGNKRAAAREAGYSTWEMGYSTIFNSRGVQHELKRRAIEVMDHDPLTPGYVLANLQEIVHRSMASEPVRDSRGNLVTVPVRDEDGEEVERAVLYTFDAKNAISALTKMGEHLQMWSPQRAEAETNTVEGELRRIADAMEGKHRPTIEAAPVRTAPDRVEKPARSLN